ncbi:MAG: DUF6036 family nucleotidyltransferase [Nannocystaceae bacterium]|nr:nucleotidyltransferase [bacterium]
MSALGDTLRALAQVLDAEGLRWYVFGAQAVNVRGAPRATQDVDITVEVDRARLAHLTSELERRGIQHRYPDIAEELLSSGAVLPMRHHSAMEVDLVIAGPGLEMLALDRAERVVVDGVPVPVACATDLVVMKVLAGRGKDQDDIRALLSSGQVDLGEARDLISQLEAALGQSDLLPILDEAIDDIG